MLRYSLLIVVVLFSGYEAFDKRKDDLVVMKSDDNFTGEIKSLHYDELIFKSDYMSREGLRACAVLLCEKTKASR